MYVSLSELIGDPIEFRVDDPLDEAAGGRPYIEVLKPDEDAQILLGLDGLASLRALYHTIGGYLEHVEGDAEEEADEEEEAEPERTLLPHPTSETGYLVHLEYRHNNDGQDLGGYSLGELAFTHRMQHRWLTTDHDHEPVGDWPESPLSGIVHADEAEADEDDCGCGDGGDDDGGTFEVLSDEDDVVVARRATGEYEVYDRRHDSTHNGLPEVSARNMARQLRLDHRHTLVERLTDDDGDDEPERLRVFVAFSIDDGRDVWCTECGLLFAGMEEPQAVETRDAHARIVHGVKPEAVRP